METSEHGIKMIEQREGIRLKGYKDSQGYPTIGVGHLITKGEPYKVGSFITQAECDQLLKDDLVDCETVVNHAVKVKLSQNQFDSLVSVSFNIGLDGFRRSTIVKRLNKGDYLGAANAMMMWRKPPEIIGRRQTEKNQFLTPDPAGPLPVASSDAATQQDTGDAAASPQAPPIIQTDPAGDTAPVPDDIAPDNTPTAPQDMVMAAPAATGAVSKSATMTVAGIAVPAFLVAIFKAIGDAISNGYIDAKDIGSTVISFVTNNTKYVMILVGLIIVFIGIKWVVVHLLLGLEMLTKAIPSWNNVSLVAAAPPEKKWWQVWK